MPDGERTAMVLTAGSSLLRGRYELATPQLRDAGDATYYWRGWSEDGARVLVKAWSYDGDEPDHVQRALWDVELRTLYKVGSTPGASDALVVLKDAGLDHDARCFVMVLEAPGFESLRDAVADRAAHPWLANRDARDRRDIWTALARTAGGLSLLHDQQILHRDVGVDAMLFDSDGGAESVRLGGFEWSVQLGRPLEADPPQGWASPPERNEGKASVWRPDDDWFGFGMLCARLLIDAENYAGNDSVTRHQRVLKAINSATRSLIELERSLLGALIAADPLERIVRPHDILGAISDIVRLLSAPPADREDARPYTLVVNPRSTSLTDYLLDQGLREHLLLTGSETYNPADVRHTAGLCDFMRRDLDDAALYAVPRQRFVIMVGHRLVLRVGPNTDRNGVKSWQTASCLGDGELRSSEGGSARMELPGGRLAVRTNNTVYKDRTVAQASAPWDDVMPRFERGAELARDLSRFQEFVRVTNQIELLLLDATIFPYELVAGPVVQEGRERIVVRERTRAEPRRVLPFFELEKGLEEFLQREMEAGKAGGGSVILSGPTHDTLMLPGGGKDNQWRMTKIDQEAQTATLERDAFDPGRPPAPDEGFLRGAGMPGQTKLIRRRKQAIDSLGAHSYLLRSLAAPGQVYIDTGASELPVRLDPEVVDSAKRAAIEDILRVRPIYTLQGPPGTGKTTLVAWLLREILMARKQLQVLRGSIGALEAQPTCSRVQDRWLEYAREMADELSRHEALGTLSNDFVELVKRGANLTYCTTSAAELEALASDQSFDWSIVEEAGKAHGFDLALPLQAGHRWLLIGDHNQLPPYREHMVLQTVAEGGVTLKALSRTFRVHERLLIEAVVTLVTAGWVAVAAGPEASFVLTAVGHEAALSGRDPVSVVVSPARRQTVVMDRITGQLARNSDARNWRRNELGDTWHAATVMRERIERNSLDEAQVQKLLPRQTGEWVRRVGPITLSSRATHFLATDVDLDAGLVRGLPPAWQEALNGRVLASARARQESSEPTPPDQTGSRSAATSTGRRGRRFSGVPSTRVPSTRTTRMRLERTDLAVGVEEHEEALRLALVGAQRSVAVVSPSVSSAEVFARLAELAAEAVGRGIRVDILVGRADEGVSTPDLLTIANRVGYQADSRDGRSRLRTRHPVTGSGASLLLYDDQKGDLIGLLGD